MENQIITAERRAALGRGRLQKRPLGWTDFVLSPIRPQKNFVLKFRHLVMWRPIDA